MPVYYVVLFCIMIVKQASESGKQVLRLPTKFMVSAKFVAYTDVGKRRESILVLFLMSCTGG